MKGPAIRCVSIIFYPRHRRDTPLGYSRLLHVGKSFIPVLVNLTGQAVCLSRLDSLMATTPRSLRAKPNIETLTWAGFVATPPMIVLTTGIKLL